MATPEGEQSYDIANEATEGTMQEVSPGGLAESPAEKQSCIKHTADTLDKCTLLYSYSFYKCTNEHCSKSL